MFIKWVTVSGTDRIVLNIFRCDLNTAPLGYERTWGTKINKCQTKKDLKKPPIRYKHVIEANINTCVLTS